MKDKPTLCDKKKDTVISEPTKHKHYPPWSSLLSLHPFRLIWVDSDWVMKKDCQFRVAFWFSCNPQPRVGWKITKMAPTSRERTQVNNKRRIIRKNPPRRGLSNGFLSNGIYQRNRLSWRRALFANHHSDALSKFVSCSLLGFTWFDWVLLGLTGFDWVWLGLTGFLKPSKPQ